MIFEKLKAFLNRNDVLGQKTKRGIRSRSLFKDHYFQIVCMFVTQKRLKKMYRGVLQKKNTIDIYKELYVKKKIYIGKNLLNLTFTFITN